MVNIKFFCYMYHNIQIEATPQLVARKLPKSLVGKFNAPVHVITELFVLYYTKPAIKSILHPQQVFKLTSQNHANVYKATCCASLRKQTEEVSL